MVAVLDKHTLVLNKFPVVHNHVRVIRCAGSRNALKLLIVCCLQTVLFRSVFEPQSAALDVLDMQALWSWSVQRIVARLHAR